MSRGAILRSSREGVREMSVIARELRCTAVRISGGDPGRLSTAGELAAAEGLEVWFDDSLHAGTPQVEIIRRTGYSRENVRTILRRAGIEPD